MNHRRTSARTWLVFAGLLAIVAGAVLAVAAGVATLLQAPPAPSGVVVALLVACLFALLFSLSGRR